MNVLRFMLFFVTVLLFATGSEASEAENQTVFPDLLSDEFLDDTELEDDDFDESIYDGYLEISDPLEPMNRLFFDFNDSLYEWLIKPFTDGYIWLVPRDLRVCFDNVFVNLRSPIVLLNTLLVADFEGAGIAISRFSINSTIGVLGLADVAALEFGMKRQKEDFGQTLGKWGVSEGIYLCWPIIGPSNVRDTVGFVADAYTHPIPYFHDNFYLDLAYYVSNKMNAISLKPDLYEDLKRFSIDPYVASRQAYYEYRKGLIESK